jgi:hypothetical protein
MKNRLTWLLVAVIAFDFGITLLGQPSSYWHDSHTANEGNPVFAWFMIRGIVSYAAFILAYIISAAVLVRVLPGRLGLRLAWFSSYRTTLLRPRGSISISSSI